MQPTKSGRTVAETRCAWEPPAVTKLPIGAQTKSSWSGAPGADVEASGRAQPALAQPQPPAAPATKLGFSFEMAFPLSSRLSE
jgi:hypothetical protein